MKALAIMLALTATAHAGLDCDERQTMASIEAFAKDKAKAAELDGNYTWVCAQGMDPKMKARVEKACRAILDRDGDASPCVTIAATQRIGTLGDHDIFALVSKLREDPIEFAGGVGWYKPALLAQLGDPRGAQVIVAMWKEAIPRADKREKRHGGMADWSSWRKSAARALGELGGADDQAFLLEQAGATKDKYVAEACRDGAAAITKRLAAKP
jgi:hypothetical protein